MRERPILFSAPMVRAILEGHKTQTRRVVKFDVSGRVALGGRSWHIADPAVVAACPYGQPGDRLWVRETYFGNHFLHPNEPEDERELHYRADGLPDFEGEEHDIRWRPSIHMPRWASRITLEVTGVRVERLQDISDADVAAEGIDYQPNGGELYRPWRGHERWWERPRPAFRDLWDHINGPESWGDDPWVWVVEFKRVAA